MKLGAVEQVWVMLANLTGLKIDFVTFRNRKMKSGILSRFPTGGSDSGETSIRVCHQQ